MNGRGVMGFPMRLALAVLLIGLCTPAIAAMAEEYSDSTEAGTMEEEIGKIVKTAKRTYLGGTGTLLETEVSVIPGYEVVIGGEGPECYSVSLKKGGSEVSRTYIEHPSVIFVNEMTLSGGCTLLFKCVNDNGYGVMVAVP